MRAFVYRAQQEYQLLRVVRELSIWRSSGQVVENYVKLARVWLEPPFLETFYKVKPEARRLVPDAPLSEPRATKKRLKCKSMAWY